MTPKSFVPSKAPTPPSFRDLDTNTVPERPETVQIQLQQLIAGKRRAVMFPKGSAIPPKPPSMNRIDTKAGTFYYDGAKINAKTIQDAVKAGQLNTILGDAEAGYGAPAKQELQGEPSAVVAKASDGTTVQAAATDDANLPRTVEAAKKVTPPDGSVAVEPPEEEVNRRQSDLPQRLAALKAGKLGVVFFPKGQQPPAPAREFAAVQLDTKAGIFFYNPTLVNPRKLRQAGATGDLSKIPGLESDTLPEKQPVEVNRGSSTLLPLSPKGQEQAQELGDDYAARGGTDQITGSSSKRAMETAAPIVAKNPDGPPPVTPKPELQSWGQGVLEGKPVEDAKPVIDALVKKAPDQAPPGQGPMTDRPGESFNQFSRRWLGELSQRMAAFDPSKKETIVTHSQGIKLLHAWLEKGMPADFSVDRNVFLTDSSGDTAGVQRLYPDAQGKWKLVKVDMKKPDNLPPGIDIVRHGDTPWNKGGNLPPKKAKPAPSLEALDPEKALRAYANLPPPEQQRLKPILMDKLDALESAPRDVQLRVFDEMHRLGLIEPPQKQTGRIPLPPPPRMAPPQPPR